MWVYLTSMLNASGTGEATFFSDPHAFPDDPSPGSGARRLTENTSVSHFFLHSSKLKLQGLQRDEKNNFENPSKDLVFKSFVIIFFPT